MMEMLVHIEWILLQFILLGKFSLCKVNTLMCETCPPAHPQQHFCNSDFVIQGKILHIDNFINPLTKTNRITTPTAAVPAVSTSATVRQDKEGQLHVALPSQKQHSSVDALPRQRDGSVFQALGGNFTEKADDGGARGRHKVPTSDAVRYTVLVFKIYKGSKWIRNRDVVTIDYVHNEEFCGLTMHHVSEETMLISGTSMRGHLVHHPCDWSIISTKIIFDVHRQLTHMYRRQCHPCTIEPKSSGLLGIHKVMTGSSGCVYKPSFYTDKGMSDCEGLYGACKKIHHGCSWSGNQRLRDCIRKRKTLLSSPSILESKTSPPRHLKRVQHPDMKSSSSLIKTSLERDADLRPSVDPAENLSEIQEISMMLLNDVVDDKEDTESPQTSDEELHHSPQRDVNADGRKQDATPTLTTQGEQSFLILPDPPEKVSPTDLSVGQSNQSSKSSSAVSNSHTAMPHYAFDLPQPHVSSQDAADILEKIAQQHLRKKKM